MRIALLVALATLAGLAGCTNPEYSYNVNDGACPQEDTTAPVPDRTQNESSDDCPRQEGVSAGGGTLGE